LRIRDPGWGESGSGSVPVINGSGSATCNGIPVIIMYRTPFLSSAAGDILPPMTVFKSGTGSLFDIWCEGGPEGSAYAANKSGYFDMEKFQIWMSEVGVKYRHIRGIYMSLFLCLKGYNFVM
jgi:hypothetical protein